MGGSAQVVFQISRTLCHKDHAVTVIASDFGINQAAFPQDGFNTTFFHNLFARWGFYVTPRLVGWCVKNIWKYDIIHLHEFRTFQNMVVRRYAVQSGIPYVLSAHGTLPVIVQRKASKQLYDWVAGKRIIKDASKVVAVSPLEDKQYRDKGIQQERIRTIFNGLNLDEFTNLPERGAFRGSIGADQESRIILFLGRLHRIKGIDVLIKAFSDLRTGGAETALVIVGPDEGELSRLKVLASEQAVEQRVTFRGPLYGRERLKAYVDADVVVSPGMYEIFGLVPFEALMCGTPVIVTQDTGAGELIEQAGAGYGVPYGDVNTLAKAIEHILDNVDEARQKVVRGQEFIRENMDWGNIAGKYIELYRECVGQR